MPHNLCIFAAEIVGGDHIVTRLGEAETNRAIERCLNRVDLAIGGSGGEIIARDRSAVIATFEQCDGGVMAACEAIDRVRKLPPVSGTHMRLRVGVHYGEVVSNHEGKGMEEVRLVLQACEADQSLASFPVIDCLSPSVRNFASTEAFHDSTLGKLPWPVFTVGAQGAQNIQSSLPSTPLRPQPSSPLLTGSKPPVASGPRLRIKHQQSILFIEESRPVVLIGRELGNDIVIIDPRASRQHARIERRREGFFLIDQSANGCFVVMKDQKERCIKGAEQIITSAGRFGCGFSPQEFEDDLVLFELV